MFRLILLAVFSLGVAFFASQNTSTVPIYFWNYSVDRMPVFGIMLISFLIGLLLNWILSSFKFFQYHNHLKNKSSKLAEAEKNISHLTKRIHQLEVENAELLSNTSSLDEKSL
ncbi:MAG: LapA family protein [Candidatus Roizmanbacteria bacterium]